MRIEAADDAMFRERDAWRYPPPYDFYDSDGLPVKNPELFYAARDDEGALIGFYFFEPCDDALFYGFGLRPDLTGRGLGEQFVLAGLAFARTIYGPCHVVLDVAAFNERAIHLYRRLVFTETGRQTETLDGHGAVEFVDREKNDGRVKGAGRTCRPPHVANPGPHAPAPCDAASSASTRRRWSSASIAGPMRGRPVATPSPRPAPAPRPARRAS